MHFVASKKVSALKKAFPSLRGLNGHLSQVVPQVPSKREIMLKLFLEKTQELYYF